MKKHLSFLLFIAGIVVTFTFITLLQFFSVKDEFWVFLSVLVLMHGGIVCFIMSKKMFKKKYAEDADMLAKIKKCFNREYYYLLWYIPVLAAKIFLPLLFPSAISFAAGSAEYYIKLGAVLTMSAIFAAESAKNAAELKKIIG